MPPVFIIIFYAKFWDGFIDSFIIGIALVWSTNWQTNLTLGVVILVLFLITNGLNKLVFCFLGMFAPIILIQLVNFLNQDSIIYVMHLAFQFINFYIILIYFNYLRFFKERNTELAIAVYGKNNLT